MGQDFLTTTKMKNQIELLLLFDDPLHDGFFKLFFIEVCWESNRSVYYHAFVLDAVCLGFFFIATPYHMNTLAIMGIITPAAVRDSTVSKNPSSPFTTFEGESCKSPKSRSPPTVAETTPTMTILRKFSERPFNAPAMYPINIAL